MEYFNYLINTLSNIDIEKVSEFQKIINYISKYCDIEHIKMISKCSLKLFLYSSLILDICEYLSSN